MIKISADMLPFGFEQNKYNISSIQISNDGTGSSTIGNYNYKLFNKNGRVIKTGKIENFNRKRNNVWKLLRLVIDDLYKK